MALTRSTKGVALFFVALVAILLLSFVFAPLMGYGYLTVFGIFFAVFLVLFAIGALARFTD